MRAYIGLVGANGSGKSTVSEHLSQSGYMVISLSDFVRQSAKEQGLGSDRDVLTQVANTLKETHGQDFLAKKAIEMFQESDHDKVVFDSIRNVIEAEYLKSQGVYLIGLVAGQSARYDRIKERAGDTDNVSLDTFKSQDDRERDGSSSGQNIEQALGLCLAEVTNDADKASLFAKVEAAING